METWQLIIDMDGNGPIVITGSEELLRTEFESWVKYKNEAVNNWDKKRKAKTNRGLPEDALTEVDETVDEYLVRVVHGVADNASRHPMEIAYRFLEVTRMALVRL